MEDTKSDFTIVTTNPLLDEAKETNRLLREILAEMKIDMAADYKTLLGLVRELAEVEGACYGDGTTHDVLESLIVRAREAAKPSAPKPVNDPSVLHMHVPDDCCSQHFAKAARAGKLDGSTLWTCPKCSGEWKAEKRDGVFYWTPVVDTFVVKR